MEYMHGSIDLTYYLKCIATLEKAHMMLLKASSDSIDYELYRSACIKEFELILEQSGKLLKKILKPYFHSPKAVDQLYFKDIFRQAASKGLIDIELCERFMEYRDNRNLTAHDYGVDFAEKTLIILPAFIADARKIAEIIQSPGNVAEE